MDILVCILGIHFGYGVVLLVWWLLLCFAFWDWYNRDNWVYWCFRDRYANLISSNCSCVFRLDRLQLISLVFLFWWRMIEIFIEGIFRLTGDDVCLFFAFGYILTKVCIFILKYNIWIIFFYLKLFPGERRGDLFFSNKRVLFANNSFRQLAYSIV